MASDDGMPPSRDITDYFFKKLLSVRVSDPSSSMPAKRSQLVSCSNKHGLIFVGSQSGFRVLQAGALSKKAGEFDKMADKTIIEDFEFLFSVSLDSPPVYLDVSGDDLTLAVCLRRDQFMFALLYDIRAFASPNTIPTPFLEVKLSSTPDLELLGFAFNPGADYVSLFASCMSDGTVGLWEVKNTSLNIITNAAGLKATCLCWSLKGKQLVVGRQDGSLTQLDHALKIKKHIPPPDAFQGNSTVQVFDVLWQSTHTFIAAYSHLSVDNETEPPAVFVVNVPKGANPNYVNYEDMCYGSDAGRSSMYYLKQIVDWELVVGASANALEVSCLGKSPDDKAVWELWNLMNEAGRAEMPMTDNYDETWPMGLAISYNAQQPIVLSETESYPAAPLLLLLSTEGVLIAFHMIYTKVGLPVVLRVPEALTADGARVGLTTPPSDRGTLASAPSTVAKALFQSPVAPDDSTSKPASSTAPFGMTPATSTPAKPFSFAQPAGSAKPIFGGGDDNSKPIFGGGGDSSKPTFGGVSSAFSLKTATQSEDQTAMVKDAQKVQPATSFSFGGSAAASSQSNSFTFSNLKFGATIGQPAATTTTATFGGSGLFGKPAAANTTVSSASTTFGGGLPSGTSLFGGKSTSTSSSTPAMSFPGSVTETKDKVPVKPALTTETAPSGTSKPTSVTKPMASSTSGGIFGTKPSVMPAAAGSGHGILGAPPTTAPTMPAAPPATVVPPTVTAVNIQQPAPPAPPKPTQQTARPAAPVSGQPQVTRPVDVTSGGLADKRPAPSGGSGKPAGVVSNVPSANNEENPFMKSIADEMSHFEQELLDLKKRASSLNVEIGTSGEMHQLRRDTEDMLNFRNEIKVTTQELNGDIHSLKSECLEAFALLEECRVREQRNREPRYQQLLKSRALDPLTARKMREMRSMYHYIENSIRQIDMKLDTDWEKYKQKKTKTRKLQTPVVDAVYQSINSYNTVISNQSKQLEKICKDLQQMGLTNTTSPWQHATPVRKRPEPEIQPDSVPRPSWKFEPPSGSMSTPTASNSPRFRTSPLITNSSPISPEKSAHLREVLGRRRVTPVKSTAPANLSMSKIVSAEGLRQMLEEEETHTQEALTAHARTSPAAPSSRTSPATASVSVSKLPGASVLTSVNSARSSQPGSNNQLKPDAGKWPSSSPGGSISIGQSPAFRGGSLFTGKPATAGTAAQATTKSSPPKDPVSIFKLGSTSLSGFSQPAKSAVTVEDISPPDSPSPPVYKTDDLPKTVPKPEPGKVGLQSILSGIPAPSGGLFGTKISAGDNGVTANDETEADAAAVMVTSTTSVARPSATVAAMPSVLGGQPRQGISLFGTSAPSVVSSSGLPANATKPKDFTFTTPASQSSSNDSKGAPAFGTSSSSSLFGATSSMPTSTSSAFAPPSSGGLFGAAFNLSTKTTDAASSSTTAASGMFSATSAFSTTSATTASVFGGAASSSQPGVTTASLSSAVQSSSVTSSSSDGAKSAASVAPEKVESKPLASTMQKDGSTNATASVLPKTGLFGASSSTTKPASIFGNADSTGSVFGGGISSSTMPVFKSDSAEKPSTTVVGGLFGSATTTTSKTGIFDTGPTVTTSSSENSGGASSSTTTGGGILGAAPAAATTASGLFGSTDSIGISGAKPTTTAATTTTTTGAGLFGAAPDSTSGGLFGTAPATTAGGSVFGGASVGGGLFGAGAKTEGGGLFGTTTTATTASTTTASSSIFGNASSAITTPSNVFGGTPATTSAATPSGIFGSTPATTSATPASSVSVAPATSTAMPSGGLFGAAATTTTAATTTASTGLFGSTAPSGGLFGATPSAGGTLFGGSSGTTPGFGTPPTTTSSSVFGTQATTAASVFGTPSATPAASVFGTPASSAPSSAFGGPATSGSGAAFSFGQSGQAGQAGGFGQPAFGQPASSGSQATFGQSATFGANNSVFGGASASTTTSGSSVFGQSICTPSGGLFSGLGGKPSAENANKNVFGGSSTFNNAAPNQGLFGQGGASAFGQSPSAGGAFGGGGGGAAATSGGFSAGGSVASTGFGGFGAQSPKAGGFGGQPAFGSPPSFGGTPGFGSSPSGFGSAPAFGGSAAFGGAGGGAGGSSGNAVFGGGSTATPSGGFASFADSASPSFGALAGHASGAPSFGGGMQQQQQQPQQPGGFGAIASGGGFGSPAQAFGGAASSPSFGGGGGGAGGQAAQGFGAPPAFGSPAPTSPSFSSYRG